MEYTVLGNTEIQISKLCVGCMSFGKAGTMHEWTLDEAETEVLPVIRSSLHPKCILIRADCLLQQSTGKSMEP